MVWVKINMEVALLNTAVAQPINQRWHEQRSQSRQIV